MDDNKNLIKEINRLKEINEELLAEKKRLSARFEASQEKLDLILKHSNNVYYNYLFKEGTWSFISDTMFQAMGVSSEDYISDGIEKAVSYLHPDDLSLLDKHLQHMLQNKLEENHNPYIEYRMKHQVTGEWRWFGDNRHVVFDSEGEAISLFGNSVDITERRQASEDLLQNQHLLKKKEKEFRSLTESSQDYITRYDEQGRHLYQNEAAYKISGLTEKNVIGKTHRELGFNEKLCDLWEKRIAHVIKFKEPSSEIFEWESAEGPVFLDSRIFPEFGTDGYVKTVLGVSRNITEQKKLESQLRQSQKMDALDSLTGGIAHDYNNMLGVIKGYAEIINHEFPELTDLSNYVHEINHAVERGTKLTKKLLAFSRNKPSEEEQLDLNKILLDERDMLEKTLTVRIKLVLNLQANLWPISVDSSDIEDAVLNLSINAMHAIESNGQLTIQTSNQTLDKTDANAIGLKKGDYVLLSISDTGCGMDEIIKEKIFEPFYSSKGEKGTGLGLSMVYSFIQRSEGAIKVYSKSGHGSEFKLYFPRDSEYQQNKQLKNEHVEIKFSGDERILIVDDEPALLKLTSKILQNYGFDVIQAKNAKLALDVLENEKVDILISDIIMPEMNGYQLAAIVNEKYPNIKIQLTSGFSDISVIDNIDENLKQDVLLKPFNAQQLLQKIQELINSN